MSPTPKDYAAHVPVPCFCKGRVRQKLNDTETYEVEIYRSKLGSFSGPIYATAIHSPGSYDNYKPGDFVKVIVYFNFGGVNQKFMDTVGSAENHIIGLFQERSTLNLKVDNLIAPQDDDCRQFSNSISHSNLSITNSGKIFLSANTVLTAMSPMGYGNFKDSHHTVAQNHHRWVGGCPEDYLAREHFGLFSGTDGNDEATKQAPDDFYVNYRRFVTQTRAADKWVSTCEGAWAPWVGVNNDFPEVSKSKECLFSKVINYELSRISIEAGEPGDHFVDMRIDKVLASERGNESAPGATPATMGALFHMQVSDAGAVSIKAGGNGLNPVTYKTSIVIDASTGDLKIYSSGKMTMSHSENDVSANSIVLDPTKGVDITTYGGFRVNGKEVTTSDFISWFQQNYASLYIVAGQATIAPNPALIPDIAKFGLPQQSGGSSTLGLPAVPPITGPLPDQDQNQSV